jgi:hypothetical protein
LRQDQDDDGFPLPVDCDDTRPDVTTLGGSRPTIPCGGSFVGLIEDGPDELDFIQCLHPETTDELVVLGVHEQVFAVRSERETDMELTLHASALLAGPPRVGLLENSNVPLLVNRGEDCGVDRCLASLPTAPPGWLRADPDPDAMTTWTPSIRFHARADETWFAIVSANTGPFTLDLRCGE